LEPGRRSGGNEPVERGGSKVLAVDDEDFNLDILRFHLVQAGHQAVLAEDGAVALKKLEENPDIEAIILDRIMPNLGGMEFLYRIKGDARFRDIPVIMQTAAAAPDQVVQGFQAGVHYYLAKPYDGAMLLSIVDAALEAARNNRSLKEQAQGYGRLLGLMESARFRFRTLDEAAGLASTIANCFPEPKKVILGLHELLINAIEHGNLGITYAEKTALMQTGSWKEEVERRLASPEYREKNATLSFEAAQGALIVHIRDAGEGFNWKDYMDFSPSRALDAHGRGIATSRAVSFDRIEYLGCGNEVRCIVTLRADR
jgi:CheY-like chemotaxis protein